MHTFTRMLDLSRSQLVLAEVLTLSGSLMFMRHNELRDITAELLAKVCSDVAIESPLQSLSGKRLTTQTANCQDDARADIHASGFWGQQQSAFFDSYS